MKHLSPTRPRADRRSRRAVAILIALVTFSIAAIVFTTMTHDLVLNNASREAEAWQAQADCLLDAGAERAAASLVGDVQYAGETWRLDAETIGGGYAGVVTIDVEPRDDVSRSVTVTADYPDDPVHRVRRVKTLTMAAAEPADASADETPDSP